MNYVILDMEWNRPERDEDLLREPFVFDSEIIEIGAILLNEDFEAAEEFKTFVRPRFYTHMNGAVASLTKIRSQLWNCSPAISRIRASSSGVTVYVAVLPFIMCRTMVSLNVSASMGAGRCSEMLVTRSRTDLMLLEVIL